MNRLFCYNNLNRFWQTPHPVKISAASKYEGGQSDEEAVSGRFDEPVYAVDTAANDSIGQRQR